MNQPFPNYVHLSPEDSIVQLNLTNRSFNALTRVGIRTVGEVLRLVKSGRLRYIRNLGRKSISEIESKLGQVKSEVGNLEKCENFDDKKQWTPLYLSQGDPIELLNLTLDSFSALTRADVRTVGEAAQLVKSGRLRTIPALGRKSFSEITAKLAQVNIFDDSGDESPTIQDRSLAQVVTWQSQLVSKQLSRGLLHENAIIAERSIKDWLSGIEKIESNRVYEVLTSILGSSLNICEEIEFFLNHIPGQYRMAVLLSTYGLERKNLRQTGKELGISHERVRQIRSELRDRAISINILKAKPSFLRMQSALFIARDLGFDITYKQWAQRIRSSGLVGDWISQDFVGTNGVKAMIAICNLLADSKIRWLQMPKNLQYAIQLAALGTPNIPAKILYARDTLSDEVKRLINRHTKFSGGVHLRWLSQECDTKLEEMKNILQGLGYSVLSKDWFAPHQISYSDVFHRCLRQMFHYCGRLGIDDICAGIRHGISRSGSSVPAYLAGKDTDGSVFPVPPPDVMAEILRIGGFQSDDELYYWDGDYNENLSKGETIIMKSLEQIGPVLHHSELVHAFIENKLSLPSLHPTLNSSPLFDKIESGLYKLRGRVVSYQDIKRAKAAAERQRLHPEIEYDTNGNIIVSVSLSAIAAASGTVFSEQFPNLSGDWDCYAHLQKAGELNATESEFRSLKKPFELLNCQPGDRLKFIFNSWNRTVAIENEGKDAKS